MRALKHILIMGVMAPWIGGTLVGYSAYSNTKVTDITSAVDWLVTAAFGTFFFGLLVTIGPNLLLTCLSFGVFLLLSQGSGSDAAKGRITILLSLGFSFAYALMIKPIADDIGTSTIQLALSCFLAGSVAAWLNYLNWQPRRVQTKDIQGAAPHGAPATPPGNSGVTEGPPSVS